jgi:outer membrane protein
MTRTTAIGILLLAPFLAAAQAATPAPGPAPSPAAAAPAPAARVVALQEAEASALAHQPQLRQAQANARAGFARADQARGPLLPQLDVSAGVQRTGPKANFVSASGGGVSRSPNQWSGDVSVSQVIFDPASFYGWRSAGASARSLGDTADTTRLDVISGVRAAYFAARANRDLAGVARETVHNDEVHLRQTEAFVEVGTQPAIALAQTRSALASARLALIQAENNYANTKAQLAQAMGLETWEPFEVGDDTLPPVQGEDAAIDPLFAEALTARPELASLQAAERANSESRAAARSGYLPTLGARGTYGETGPSLNTTQGQWTLGLSLTWNLFNGGTTAARVREAEANLDSLRAQEDALRTSIRVAVEQALLGVGAARSSVQAATEAETNAREQLRLAEGRYQAGAGSIIELGDAQVTVNTAAAQRVQTEYNLAAARAALLRALGRS